MLEGVHSRTALEVAALRAIHQVIDNPPVFSDPLAGRILGSDSEALLENAYAGAGRSMRLRTGVAVRQRVAEDAMREAAGRGVGQYVLLGAGLDTFACRQVDSSVRVFEVDHPDTQRWKRALLETSGLGVPEKLTFVPVDFGRERLVDALESGGFDFNSPALFAMLGVAVYVERESVLETLGLIASLGSEVVFDYTEPYQDAPPALRAAYETLAQRVAEKGEPWITHFRPDEMR